MQDGTWKEKRICDGMTIFIPKVALKNNKELKPKCINNKDKRCLQKNIHATEKTYLFQGAIIQLME